MSNEMSDEVKRAIEEQQERIERGEDSSDRVPGPGGWTQNELSQKAHDEEREDEREAQEYLWEKYEKFIRDNGVTEQEFSSTELYRYFESETLMNTDEATEQKIKQLTAKFDEEN